MHDSAQRPPHVWSFLPYLGSAVDMGRGIHEFIRRHSAQFGGSPIFTATILGDKCVFIADPELLTCVFRSSYQQYLDSMSLQKQFVRNVLGVNTRSPPGQLNEIFRDDVVKIGIAQYHHFLFKGQELENSIAKVQDIFLDLVPQLVSCNREQWTAHNLFEMVRRVIFKASVAPLLSGSMISDEVLQEFCSFDAGVILLFNKAPEFVTKKAVRAREQLLARLECTSFWKLCSPLMIKRKEHIPVSKEALNKANLGLLWASVGNSVPAVFWTLLLLLEHKDAWDACKAQVESVVAKRANSSSSSSLFTLDELDELTLLQSAFMETLRLNMGNFSARKVKQSFTLETASGPYLIEQGSMLMPFWGILHTDPHVFENPEKFQYDRFADPNKVFTYKSGKKLTHSPPVIAFGGGAHLCPGRKFIAYEVRLFVAMLMQNFDIQLAEGYQRPGINPALQGIGVSHPDKDPTVKLRLRDPVDHTIPLAK